MTAALNFCGSSVLPLSGISSVGLIGADCSSYLFKHRTELQRKILGQFVQTRISECLLCANLASDPGHTTERKIPRALSPSAYTSSAIVGVHIGTATLGTPTSTAILMVEIGAALRDNLFFCLLTVV